MSPSDTAIAVSPPRSGRRLTGQLSGLVHRGTPRLWADRGRDRRELEELGLRPSRTSNAPVWALAGLLFLAAGAAAAGAATHSLSTQTAVGLAASVVTVAGLFVAVLQWRLGLSEKAFDALYHRIAMANEMRLEAFKGLKSASEETVAKKNEELYRFFVFTEIDSLEYAVRRYRRGFGVSHEVVNRAVRHFRIRCGSETFRRTALECVEGSAYFCDTKCMVATIVRKALEGNVASPDCHD